MVNLTTTTTPMNTRLNGQLGDEDDDFLFTSTTNYETTQCLLLKSSTIAQDPATQVLDLKVAPPAPSPSRPS